MADSWNMKPILADAVADYPYFLRIQAQECLCPLNNLRLLADGLADRPAVPAESARDAGDLSPVRARARTSVGIAPPVGARAGGSRDHRVRRAPSPCDSGCRGRARPQPVDRRDARALRPPRLRRPVGNGHRSIPVAAAGRNRGAKTEDSPAVLFMAAVAGEFIKGCSRRARGLPAASAKPVRLRAGRHLRPAGAN